LKIENLDQSKDMLNTIENDINMKELTLRTLWGKSVRGSVLSRYPNIRKIWAKKST
jgi:hypothetical protein